MNKKFWVTIFKNNKIKPIISEIYKLKQFV